MRHNNILFMPVSWEQIMLFAHVNPKLAIKILKIIDEIKTSPFKGIGKPEPLRGDLSGYWSRRITDEHRLIYKVEKDTIIIFRAKGHYLDK